MSIVNRTIIFEGKLKLKLSRYIIMLLRLLLITTGIVLLVIKANIQSVQSAIQLGVLFIVVFLLDEFVLSKIINKITIDNENKMLSISKKSLVGLVSNESYLFNDIVLDYKRKEQEIISIEFLKRTSFKGLKSLGIIHKEDNNFSEAEFASLINEVQVLTKPVN